MKPTRMPRARSENLIIRTLGDEILVYDTERDQAHCLNHIAAKVWEHCDGKKSAEQTARTLEAQMNLPVNCDVVWLAVTQLQRFHLVENTERLPQVSRRRLMLKYAPAALALPVIMSISTPAAAQAASNCSIAGQSCATRPCCPGLGLACQPGTLICQVT